MEIMDFCQKVKKGLNSYIGETVAINIKKIVKNNGIVLHSIIITEKEHNISPNIYLDELYEAYESGETFCTIMEEVLHTYEQSRVRENVDMSFFLNYDSMKDKVVYKIISYEKNKELLLQVPHIAFLDLAMVFYCNVPKRELGSATILIYNNHLNMWKVSREQLYQDAKRNTPRIMQPSIFTIEDMMREIFLQTLKEKEDSAKKNEEELLDQKAAKQLLYSVTEEEMAGKMFILTNDKKLFGAAVLLYEGLLEKIAQKLGENFFILPSSIHEVILIPDDGKLEAEELWKMVCEVNATQVEPEEVLTDSVYYFSLKNKKIEKLF